ncbi:putative protein FAM90A23P [Suricata suricatta]|uniref:putative protein FAM90A23P n=1 Tax=Suricata suricatta TaxID=37032 RepID=UPI001155AD87|nr:putative protein FAM90A23P [Suricata suricatta]
MCPRCPPHMQTAGKRWAQITDEMCQSPRKKACWSPCQQTPRSTGGTHVGLGQSVCRPAKGSACPAPGAAVETRQTAASEQSLGLQPPRPRPPLVPVRACTVPPCPPWQQAAPVSQPLRMLFSRLDEGGWSSSFLEAPSLPPPQKLAHPGQGPPVTHVSQGPCVPVPRSVLHDDLQLSSSLEESDHE